ncbi:VQ motif-containing protein 20 isoform X2 [Citrus clementina]|uniref:VQ motif-containing protein 20 isoform X2 n=1 Tax=Citrus clementina TaxID=85681 RepID=UPI000CED3C9B|nr:VQ motif-containing protein 20 isoform X2 [Citrus x clementina]
MRPTSAATQQCNNDNNNNQNNNNNNNNSPPLKINKDSHFIKKSSASASASVSLPPSHRHPVIIYTHSPKIIHTHPRDFMVLVQKLTGLSRSSDDNSTEKCNGSSEEENNDSNNNNIKSCKIAGMDDESTSVITTDENCSGGNIDDGQIFCARIISSFIITQLIRCFSRRISEGQFRQHIRQQLKA